MDAIYKYDNYEEFLKNVRGLQDIMTEDAYFVINRYFLQYSEVH